MGHNGGSLCGTGVEDSLLAFLVPRGLVWGASGTLSALGYVLLQTSLDGQASGGQGRCPSALPTRVPLDPVGLSINRRMHSSSTIAPGTRWPRP